MPDLSAKNATARQVEMFIRRLPSLSTFPQVAAAAFALLCEKPLQTQKIIDLIESDPALTVRILSLAAKESSLLNGSSGRIDRAVEKLPIEKLREAVLSIPVFTEPASAAEHELVSRTDRYQLARHCLAVACGAREIAKTVLPEDMIHMAFTAGLLHDLGKLALVEVMPRSFVRLAKQSRIEGISLARMEQQHLGMDHTRIGKQLAEKWNLPEPVRAGIWLHHSDPDLLVDRFELANVAQVVHLANLLSKKCGLTNCEEAFSNEQLRSAAFSLKISMEVLDRIAAGLPAMVESRCSLLGIEPAGTERHKPSVQVEDYYHSVHNAASVLARENLSLSSLSASLRQSKEQIELTDTFLASLAHPLTFEQVVSSMISTVYGGSQSACAIVLPLEEDPLCFYCHLMDRQGRQYVKLIYKEKKDRFYPDDLTEQTDMIASDSHLNWLFERLEQKIDPAITRLTGLFSTGRPMGLLLLEAPGAMHEPQRYALLCRTGASLIACAAQSEKQKGLSEKMVELFGTMQETGQQKTQQEILEGVAEMAAGAAHELNNPLSIISGRIQQLAALERDADQKQMLDLVREKADEMSLIVKDLVDYARPCTPEKKINSVTEILTAAMNLASQYEPAILPVLEISNIQSLPDVYVDLTQIAQSIYCILENAMQAYPEKPGRILIDRAAVQPGGFSAITLSDEGIGMEPQVMMRAFEPFFSYRPAGRRRGMGLAHARRLITLNGGSIRLDSTPNQGTTVNIQLPGV